MKKLLFLLGTAGYVSAFFPSFPHYYAPPLVDNTNPAALRVCSYASGRIINGFNTGVDQFPFFISLALRFNKDEFSCGGTLITNQFVLTAAHCFVDDRGGFPDEILAIYGTNNLTSDDAIVQHIYKFHVHNHFSMKKKTNDIALALMERPVQLSKTLQRACLPFGMERIPYFYGIVTGFGSTKVDAKGNDLSQNNELKHTLLQILADEQCNSTKRFWKKNTYHPESQICAFQSGTDACIGDSGGPLFAQSGDAFVVLGIVSYGYGCALNVPSIFTRVSHYIDWIQHVMYHILYKANNDWGYYAAPNY